MNQFTLGTTSKKYTCPQCGQKTFKVSTYVDTKEPVDETRFGRCERVNFCGYILLPGATEQRTNFTPRPDPKYIFILPSQDQIRAVVNFAATSNFHSFIKSNTTIPAEHLELWGVCSHRYYSDRTVYLFQRISDRAIVNWKIFAYKSDGHRNKDIDSYSLSAPKYYFEKDRLSYEVKYPMCLFGEHLLGPVNDTPVMVVESEKTAVLSSFYYPQYKWVSCGAANGLTVVSKHKTKVLQGRKVYWVCDSDKAGRENRSIDNLQKAITSFDVIDLFPERIDGYDLGDSILDGYLPSLINE
jgi:hypothetical protein